MNKKIYSIADVAIWDESGRFFIYYDAGGLTTVFRRDEITIEEAQFACLGLEQTTQIINELRNRLSKEGVDFSVSNLPLPIEQWFEKFI